MNIYVHIERLIVDGVDIGASGAIDLQAAMQSRLTQLLTEQGLPSRLGKTAWVPEAAANTMSITSSIDGATLGTRAAESLHAGLASHAAPPEAHNGNAHRA